MIDQYLIWINGGPGWLITANKGTYQSGFNINQADVYPSPTTARDAIRENGLDRSKCTILKVFA